MPLRDDLLQPIAGENPSGISMRYERVYDQIKEARAEDDDTLPSGAWERQAKRADSTLVIKLASEVLLTKSKDLQIAAWLGEAHLKKEGATQITPVLSLLLDLQKTFWDTIYPEIDEGDTGLRAVPLQWAANRYATLVFQMPVAKGAALNFFTYKSGRAIGYAADAEGNESKSEARSEAIARGGQTAESVDDAIAATPKTFYAALNPLYQDARDKLEELALFCEEQYGDDGPTFRKLRDSLEEVHNLVNSLLNEKRQTDPDPVEDGDVEAEPEEEQPAYEEAEETPVAAAPRAKAAPRAAGTGRAPATWEEATAQVHACASFMASEGPVSPIPYLLHGALRWGELREAGPEPPLELLVPPPTEIRSGMKLAASSGDWGEVRSLGLKAMAEPCARCWLDVHRYLWVATEQLGYAEYPGTILRHVQVLLTEFPEMPQWTFLDDTPVANAETQRWITEEITPRMQGSAANAEREAAPPPPPVHLYVPRPPEPREDYAGGDSAAEAKHDLFFEASQLAGAGQLQQAMAMLTQDAATQTSGRMRAQRRVETAELCLQAGSSAVAASILRDVVSEMEQRKLDTWETRETVARPLALLLRCTSAESATPDWEMRFARLCALDPGAALEMQP